LRILYGVVGEGMGHATRSAVVLEHLLASGHEIKVVVSGRAHGFLRERFAGRDHLAVEEIHGITLKYFGNKLRRTRSLFWNLENTPKAVRKNVEVYRRVAEEHFRPQLVVSDFESWAALYGLRHRIPVVSIDNIQAINRLKHDRAIRKGKGFDFRLARMAVKMKVPGAYHYLITSFFFPPVRRKYTTLVPPILRPEIVEAKREPKEHVVVYVRTVEPKTLAAMLRRLPYEFRLYGAEEESVDGNVWLRPFSSTNFLDDLRTAKAAISGGGFSLISEAVSLCVPLLSVPIEGQYEQELNARYLEQLGYGAWAKKLRPETISGFLERVDAIAETLSGYARRDNGMLFACLDELLEGVAHRKKRPKRLSTPSMGQWEGAAEKKKAKESRR
jgi:uncharacterized protein (TIGR00661 family)